MSIRVLFKLFILGGLGIALLIALASINGLVRERKQRQFEVEHDIAQSYAGAQQLVGPLLMLTLEDTWTETQRDPHTKVMMEIEKRELRTLTLFPETFSLSADIGVEERMRGIFKARVFQSTGSASGRFRVPGEDEWRIHPDRETRLVSSRVVLGVRDPRGLSSVPVMTLDTTPLEWESGSGPGTSLDGIHAPFALTPSTERQHLDFDLKLDLHGMGDLHIIPVGSENHVTLRSAWPHPSFNGDFLPVTRSVSDSGFKAEWKVNGLASNVRQSLRARSDSGRLQKLGVSLIDPITPYPLTDRALKYGFLFIGITFAAFFLYEIIQSLRIHPIQYGFVGFAQALFFLLLLGLSEHIRFGLAYAIGASATSLLLGVYVGSILGGPLRGAGFGSLMFLLYGALYGLLQSEDHALVAGSLLLFTLLGAVMLLTRNVDWYALTAPSPKSAPPRPPAPPPLKP